MPLCALAETPARRAVDLNASRTKNMRTPLHFKTTIAFRIYVLQCALRDREGYADSIKQCKDMDGQKRETWREIACVKAEIKRLEYKRTA